MAKYLTQEWLDETKRLAVDQLARPDVTARLQYVVVGAPAGDVRYYWVVQDGKLLDAQLGTTTADVTMTAPYETWVQIALGELDPSAAYMQGVVKVNGDMGRVLKLLPMTRSPEYRDLMARLRAATEY